jgi:queuosine precursor transporter
MMPAFSWALRPYVERFETLAPCCLDRPAAIHVSREAIPDLSREALLHLQSAPKLAAARKAPNRQRITLRVCAACGFTNTALLFTLLDDGDAMKQYKYYPVITGLFTVCLLMSNLFDIKIFMLGPLALPAGIIVFPIAYVFGDILTEVYGYAASRRVIWTGLVCMLLFILLTLSAIALPPAPFWSNQKEFALILGKVPRLVIASITAYFLGEFTNSFVVAKMKVRSAGRRMGLRFVMSTLAGEAVDTVTFVVIAFTGTMSVADLVQVTISAWAVKVAWEIIALPISLPLTKWLKRIEHEDYFDTHTNFSPFAFN